MSFRSLLCMAVAVSGVACSDDVGIPTAPAAPAAQHLSLYLSVSTMTAAAGDDVTVGVNAMRGEGAAIVGSFTIDVLFDPAALEFVSSAPSTEGMTLANGTPTGARVAGASSAGFASPQLASFVVRPRVAGALESLQVSAVELNSTRFEDLRRYAAAARGVFAHGVERATR